MKRKIKFSFAAFVGALLIALIVGVLAMGIAEFNGASAGEIPLYGIGAALMSFALSNVPGDGKRKGFALTTVQTEIWTNYIDENLYKNNDWIEQTMDHSEYVDDITVHSPQAGDDGTVEVNRTSLPASIETRTDTVKSWDMDEFTVNPFLIRNAEEVELSYNKLDSMLYSRRAKLDQDICTMGIYRSAPTATATLRNSGGTNTNIFRSSGIPNLEPTGTIRYSAGYLPSTTGVYRKDFTLYDIMELKSHFDDNDVPAADRHLLLSSRALRQIINDLAISKYRDASADFDTKEGRVSRLFGFDFHVRSSTVRYNSAGTPVAKAPSAAAASTDNDAILAWQKAGLRRAMGETKFFGGGQGERPEYYGKIFSFLKRFGMTISRNDELGVAAIVQTPYVPAGV